MDDDPTATHSDVIYVGAGILDGSSRYVRFTNHPPTKQLTAAPLIGAAVIHLKNGNLLLGFQITTVPVILSEQNKSKDLGSLARLAVKSVRRFFDSVLRTPLGMANLVVRPNR